MKPHRLNKGDSAEIIRIEGDKRLKSRLYAFGMIPGETFVVKAYSIGKKTMKIEINNTEVALRTREFRNIEVKKRNLK